MLKYKKLSRISGRLKGRIQNSSIKTKRVIITVTVVVTLLIIMAIEVSPVGYTIAVGKPSPRKVIAHRTLQYIDEAKTDEQREAAAAAVDDVYEYDKTVPVRVSEDIGEFFRVVNEVKPLDIDVNEKIKLVQDEVDAVSAAQLDELFRLSAEQAQSLQRAVEESVVQVMDTWIMPDDLETARNTVRARAAQYIDDPVTQSLCGGVASSFVIPNMVLDTKETERRKEAAREAVEPVITTVLQGDKIISKGEIITEEKAELLKRLGFKDPNFSWISIFYFGAFILLVIIALGLFIFKYEKELYENTILLILLGALLVTYTGLAKVVAIAAGSWSPAWGFAVPTAAIAIIAAVLVDRVVAIIMVILCALLTGAMTGGSFSMVAVAMIGGFYPAIAVSRLSTRHELRRASLYTAFWVALVAFAVSMISQDRQNFLLNTGIGFLNGFISSIIAMGILPFLETTLKVTTNPWLLEIASPDQELLKQLSIKAPGTYSHSVMVANLAEAAAREVGSDPLLARVAAYYHDIGKMKRAQFFIENQPEGSNPHQRINPNLSMLIIASHVKDGVELLNEYHLPDELIDIVKQHHGTSVVKYFYEKAYEQDEAVDENRFRYRFEKPKSKTAAILLLADSVEAAARTLPSTSAAAIEQMVNRIVDEKIDDGQLDECDITFSDINKIKNTFAKILISTYHPRISYPKSSIPQKDKR